MKKALGLFTIILCFSLIIAIPGDTQIPGGQVPIWGNATKLIDTTNEEFGVAHTAGVLQTIVNSSALPSGASTEDKQDDAITEIQNAITELQSLLTELKLKADLTETQPVSNASLPLPSGAATSANQTSGGQKTKINDSIITGRSVGVSPNRNLQTASAFRLVGTAFDGDTLDTNFWTSTVTNGGTVTIGGEAELETNTTANGTAKLESVRKGRFIVGTPMEFKTTLEWKTVGDADNLRRIGCYDSQNGFFVQLDGTTFSIGTRTYATGSAVDTLVNSGSFNGAVSTYAPGTTRHKCLIQYTARAVYLIIDGVYIHKVSLDHENSPMTYTFPITIENINDNSNATNNQFHIVGAVISRIGEFITNPTYYHVSGNAGTHILKRTAGVLQKIIFNNTSGTSITIYDNFAGSGTVIGIITTTQAAIGEWTYNAPFSTGLTLVTVGNGLDATIVYE